MKEQLEGLAPSKEKEQEPKNQGQEIHPGNFEDWWRETTYQNGGFEYKIQPSGLEAKNQREIDERVAAGEDREKVLDELAEEYIKRQSERLGIDPEGYVSTSNRIYQSISDPKIQELEEEKE